MKSTKILIAMAAVCLLIGSCKKEDTPADTKTTTTTTPTYGTMKDIDGNIYKTVTIGTQVWMAENLKVTKYRNGDAIPNVTDNTTWSNLTSGAYCSYDNNDSNVVTYGRLYNWYAVKDSRNIAPTGWHVPTDAEWTTLTNYLGGEGLAGGKLKEIGTTHWTSPNKGADNSSGFTALSGGDRFSNGTFNYVGDNGFWWSFTEDSSVDVYFRYLFNYSTIFCRYSYNKSYGFSVRCVKD